MTRSTKYPIVKLSRRYSDNIHSRVRSLVKRELQKEEPDLYIIEGGPRVLDMEEWGTRLGFDITKILEDEEAEEQRQQLMRK